MTKIFISSSCYELRDLRAALRFWLADRGLSPRMSDEGGFPHRDGIPPYAACLPVLEECQLIIGVIDREYGRSFDDWGPYSKLKGCSPTHGELKHALDMKKRVLLYVQSEVISFYEVWRKNKSGFSTEMPKGLDVKTLELIAEFKKMKPVPWLETFRDVSDIQRMLSKEFANQIQENLIEREKAITGGAKALLAKVLELDDEEKQKFMDSMGTYLPASKTVGNVAIRTKTMEQIIKIFLEGSAAPLALEVIKLLLK